MRNIIRTYFDAFNAKDIPAMLACLSEDVAHHVNEGDVRIGKQAFSDGAAVMNLCPV